MKGSFENLVKSRRILKERFQEEIFQKEKYLAGSQLHVNAAKKKTIVNFGIVREVFF